MSLNYTLVCLQIRPCFLIRSSNASIFFMHFNNILTELFFFLKSQSKHTVRLITRNLLFLFDTLLRYFVTSLQLHAACHNCACLCVYLCACESFLLKCFKISKNITCTIHACKHTHTQTHMNL